MGRPARIRYTLQRRAPPDTVVVAIVRHAYWKIAGEIIVIVMGAIAPCPAADGGDDSAFDRIWRYATLYDDQDNHYIQKFALSGRLQFDSALFDADQGRFSDGFIWRRFRFGFKANLFHDWVVHIEGDFDLDESLRNSYTRLTDAYVGWTANKTLNLKVLKQSVGFTLDGATSSKKLLTMQRNNLSNNLWFTDEYFTGITAKGEVDKRWKYQAGIFSSDGADGLSRFDASYFTLLSLGYQFSETAKLTDGLIRMDFVYNDENANSATPDFSQVLSLVSKWESGPWGFRTDLSAGKGYAQQSDAWGLVLMPYYDFNPRIQTVLRYTYVSSTGDNGVRLTRYANSIVNGRGNEYNETYAGLNVYFYGQKLKWQTGVEYASMDDEANDGGEYRGWGLSTGLRLYW
jgi:phosphate-selective porin OprO/OprP